MITVTDEQIAERDRWEEMLKRGEITLSEALPLCMRSGAPATEYLTDRVERAFSEHLESAGGEFVGDDGKSVPYDTLARAFGLQINQRGRNRIKRLVEISHLRKVVDDFHAGGLPKTLDNAAGRTAFDAAAEQLGKSARTVSDIYYGKE